MKPLPRIRKTMKWGGAAVTVLLVVVCLLTIDGQHHIYWSLPGCGRANIHRAALFVQPRGNSEACIHYRGGDGTVYFDWVTYWIPMVRTLPEGNVMWMPLPFPLAVSLAATIVAWRLDTLARRRARLNLCPKCNYDRAGLRGGVGAKCPECGAGGVPT